MTPKPQRPAIPTGTPLSISRGRAVFVAPERVITRIAEQTARLPARRRPSDRQVRDAVAVSLALAERVRSQGGAGERWQSGVPEDLEALEALSGATAAEVEEALELLGHCQVVQREVRGRDAWLLLAESVTDELPGLAYLDWDTIRHDVQARGGSQRPALAVIAEIARISGGPDVEGYGPWCSATHRTLCDATYYQQTAVITALQVLEEAGLLERETRAGRRGGNAYRLLPPAFGVSRPARASAAPDVHESGSPRVSEPARRSEFRENESPRDLSRPELGPGAWLQVADGPRVWVPRGMVAVPRISEHGDVSIQLFVDPDA